MGEENECVGAGVKDGAGTLRAGAGVLRGIVKAGAGVSRRLWAGAGEFGMEKDRREPPPAGAVFARAAG
mgnify:CR=1 FL=1